MDNDDKKGKEPNIVLHAKVGKSGEEKMEIYSFKHYPGQFRNLAPAISNGGNNRVIFDRER